MQKLFTGGRGVLCHKMNWTHLGSEDRASSLSRRLGEGQKREAEAMLSITGLIQSWFLCGEWGRGETGDRDCLLPARSSLQLGPSPGTGE